MEAVDGEGVAPSLAKPEGAAGPQKKVEKTPKGVADKRAAAAEAVSAETPFDPIAALEEALGPQETSPQDPALTNDDGSPLAKSAQERFQALANRASAAEERSSYLEQQVGQAFQQFQNEMRSMSDRNHQLEVQLARMNERMLHVGRQAQGPLTPEQEFERDMVQRTGSAVERRLAGTIQGLQQQVQQLTQQREQDRRDQEIATNKTRYNNESRYAARNTVLEGFTDDEAKDLLPLAQDYVLSKAWARRTNAAEAAKMVRQDFLRVALSMVKAQARINQAKRQQGDSAPNAPPRGGADGSGEVEPTFEELRAAGYNGINPFMDWELDGRKPLRRSR